jgi:hypothetical protein
MNSHPLSREKLIELAAEIRDALDRGKSCTYLRALFDSSVSCPAASNMCSTDLPPETIVDFCLGWEKTQQKLSREELLDLVRKIKSSAAMTEAESMLRVEAFEYNCIHPAKTNLLFYPHTVFDGGRDPTSEEIADMALTAATSKPEWEPPVSDSVLENLFKVIESREYSDAMKGARDHKRFLHAILFSRGEVGKLMLGSLDVQKKIYERLMQLAETDFDGEENPRDVAMAAYLWVLGKKVRELVIPATRRVKTCRGCKWAKEMAELWGKLDKPDSPESNAWPSAP